MSSRVKKVRAIVSLSLIFILWTAYAQAKYGIGKTQNIVDNFYKQDTICRDLVKSKKWKEAESSCKNAVQIAEKLGNDRELEKMGAYEKLGHALMGQERYQDALVNYSLAVDVVRSKLTEKDAELGRLYGDVAIAHHSLRKLDKALEFYRKAEKTYQIAYSNINEDEVTEEGVDMKRGYMRALKQLLQYHVLAAQQAGQTEEAEAIKKQIETLPE